MILSEQRLFRCLLVRKRTSPAILSRLILTKDGSMILDGQRRTVFHSDQRPAFPSKRLFPAISGSLFLSVKRFLNARSRADPPNRTPEQEIFRAGSLGQAIRDDPKQNHLGQAIRASSLGQDTLPLRHRDSGQDLVLMSTNSRKIGQLIVEFSNWVERAIDLDGILNKGKFSELRDPKVFCSARISFDTIEWSNGLDICPEYLFDHSKTVAALR